MSSGTGIYVPREQLGDGTSDSTKFLRGDSTWADPSAEFSPEAFLALLVYAFQRIEFLEHALKISYKSNDINTPDEYSLVEDRL